MPRISQQARAARRAQIVDAARVTFSERGFRQTSMDDILRAAGVSAGGAYRYFASKDEIVAAVASETVSQMTDAIESIAVSPDDPAEAALPAPPQMPLGEAMRQLIDVADRISDGPGRLALMVWGEAQSDAAIQILAREEASQIKAAVIELVRRTQRPRGLADVPADMLGSALFSLVAGYLMQRRVIGEVDAATYAATVERLLSWQESRDVDATANP